MGEQPTLTHPSLSLKRAGTGQVGRHEAAADASLVVYSGHDTHTAAPLALYVPARQGLAWELDDPAGQAYPA